MSRVSLYFIRASHFTDHSSQYGFSYPKAEPVWTIKTIKRVLVYLLSLFLTSDHHHTRQLLVIIARLSPLR